MDAGRRDMEQSEVFSPSRRCCAWRQAQPQVLPNLLRQALGREKHSGTTSKPRLRQGCLRLGCDNWRLPHRLTGAVGAALDLIPQWPPFHGATLHGPAGISARPLSVCDGCDLRRYARRRRPAVPRGDRGPAVTEAAPHNQPTSQVTGGQLGARRVAWHTRALFDRTCPGCSASTSDDES